MWWLLRQMYSTHDRGKGSPVTLFQGCPSIDCRTYVHITLVRFPCNTSSRMYKKCCFYLLISKASSWVSVSPSEETTLFCSLSAQILHPLSGENFCASVLVCILYGEGRGRTELWSMTLSKSFLLPRACLLICKIRWWEQYWPPLLSVSARMLHKPDDRSH